jgi:hypothetical protein
VSGVSAQFQVIAISRTRKARLTYAVLRFFGFALALVFKLSSRFAAGSPAMLFWSSSVSAR